VSYAKIDWLDAADSTTVTDHEELAGVHRFTLQARSTGSPTSANVVLQGSVDGSVWATILDVDATTSASESGEAGPFKYIRINLATLSGGSSPTVTASVMAAATD
jgi:hypothetical protein